MRTDASETGHHSTAARINSGPSLSGASSNSPMMGRMTLLSVSLRMRLCVKRGHKKGTPSNQRHVHFSECGVIQRRSAEMKDEKSTRFLQSWGTDSQVPVPCPRTNIGSSIAVRGEVFRQLYVSNFAKVKAT
ncbi:hypothetical protein F2P81_009575 [Scophthalmus maximus]|uniref:Uncharacterized protein n=1 Tax=Scophthalmus maximus TaxID=52904 RepID=A0A6A4T7P6_SCOMX|nr:hypothetical protein F2P81_009575 [Scophthalmus maximus]